MFIVKFKGGIGNQIFEYSFALFLKEKFPQADISFDLSSFECSSAHGGYLLDQNDFKIAKSYNNHAFKKINEQNCDFDFRENENIVFHGFWQDRKFLPKNLSPIKEMLDRVLLSDKSKEFLALIQNSQSPVSIYIRRGDYINHFLLGNVANKTYYENAIKYICEKIKNPTFFVFSNDIEWVKDNLDFRGCEVCYSSNEAVGKSAFEDLILMSKCEHNIISNSSFSWWAQQLNEHKDKIAIAPNYWNNLPCDCFDKCVNNLHHDKSMVELDNIPLCDEKPINPTFSIIISFYNCENFVRGTLASALSQSYQDIEIIAVNDASTDNTLSLLEAYASKNKKITIINKKENEGLLASRISGIEVASGKYIMFLDGDDTLFVEACEVVAKEIKSDLDIYEYDFTLQPSNKIKQSKELILPKDMLKELLNLKACSSICNKAYKAVILKKSIKHMNKFYANMGEDSYCSFVFNYFAQTKTYIEKSLFNYVVGVGMSTKSKTSKENNFVFSSLKRIYDNTEQFVKTNIPELSNELENFKRSFVLYAIKTTILEQTIKEEEKESFELLRKYFSIEDMDKIFKKHKRKLERRAFKRHIRQKIKNFFQRYFA